MEKTEGRLGLPQDLLVPAGDLGWVCGLARSTGSRPSARARKSQAPQGPTSKCRGSAQGPERPARGSPREIEKKDALAL